MNFFEVTAIAVGLSMDCLAIAVATGLGLKRLHITHALKMALFFSVAQALMPVIGWWAGSGLRDFIAAYDHWVAFVLLSGIGLKMIWEARRVEKVETLDRLNTWILLMLAVSTSIDALIVGVSLSFINVSIVRPVLIIGAVTFALSFGGVYLGEKVGHFFEGKI